jgi:hypothetical protein
VREGGGERGIERGKEPNKTSRGKRIEWGAQGQDMIINDKHDTYCTVSILYVRTDQNAFGSPTFEQKYMLKRGIGNIVV